MFFYLKTTNKLEINRNEYFEMINRKAFVKKNFSTGFLSQNEVNKICLEYNIPLVKQAFIKPDELKFYKPETFPLVIKGINKSVIHKSELDAVKLNVSSKEELLLRGKEIENSFEKNGFKIDEFLIQPQISIKNELLIGGFRDPSFGPVIMFGSGGKYVEVFEDTSLRSCFLCDDDIEEMINETKIGKILKGVRGELPVDFIRLREIIKSCAVMMLENQEIVEFDLNPLIVTKDNNFYAVDVRIKIN